MKAFIHGHQDRPDGRKDSFWTQEVKLKTAKYDTNKRQSAYMVLWHSRWHRVYMKNSCTMLIHTEDGQLKVTVAEDNTL